MAQKKKGYGLLLINYEFEQASYRKGALADAKSLQAALEAKGLNFTRLENKSSGEMLRAVEDLANGTMCNLDDYESIWLIISSHGDWDRYNKQSEHATPHSSLPGGDTSKMDFLHGSRGVITVDMLTETLTAKNYSKLKGKPIIIIIQACRGDELPESVNIEVDKTDGCVMSASKADASASYGYMPSKRALEDYPDKVPVYENQLLLWSTTGGNYAFRRPLFEQMMKALKKEDLHKVDVESLFLRVAAMVQEDFISNAPSSPSIDKRKITPVCYSMMMQEFFLA